MCLPFISGATWAEIFGTLRCPVLSSLLLPLKLLPQDPRSQGNVHCVLLSSATASCSHLPSTPISVGSPKESSLGVLFEELSRE